VRKTCPAGNHLQTGTFADFYWHFTCGTNHSRIYYEHNLQSASNDEIVSLQNSGGEFVAAKDGAPGHLKES
jgi:hypothetical protein